MFGRFCNLVIILFAIAFTSNGYQYEQTCYKCAADSKMGPCGSRFTLFDREHFQENCKSGWCLKVEVGAGGSLAWKERLVGSGHIER